MRLALLAIKVLRRWSFLLPLLAFVYGLSALLLSNRIHKIEGLNSYPGPCLDCMDGSPVNEAVSKLNVAREQNHSLNNGDSKHILPNVIQPGEKELEKIQLPYFVDSRNLSNPGEGGAPVLVQETGENKDLIKEGWARHHFNEYASMQISVHRSLPDCRSEACQKWIESYTGPLPEISVIFIFNNEAWTTLLRSVHSVINRTPEHLLREVIIVDDNSNYDFLKAPLERYFRDFGKVKIIRSGKKVGLTRARLLGFEASSAPVLVFLDSHIECFQGWAESMLIRIAENPQAVVYPIIESIMDTDFSVRCSNEFLFYSTFKFKDLQMSWEKIPQREADRRKDGSYSFRSPTMPGGLFAISREFFLRLGTYDPDLGFWGGENMELSFKTWMCGGTLEMDPCSHISHVFRKGTPVKGSHETVLRNSVRVAQVWMDDYKNYFLEKINFKEINYGNISDRQQLRQNLKCETFGWYLKNIYPEAVYSAHAVYAGEIRSMASPKCMDSGGNGGQPITYSCHGDGQNQIWYMDEHGQIYQDTLVVCAAQDAVILREYNCGEGDALNWQYNDDKTIKHIPTGQCMTAGATDNRIYLSPCNGNNWQQWEMTRRRADLTFPL